MDEEVSNIKIAMAKFETKLTNTGNTVKRIEDKLDKFIDCAEKKFSKKWVEDVLIWGGGIIGSALLLALMALILKK